MRVYYIFEDDYPGPTKDLAKVDITKEIASRLLSQTVIDVMSMDTSYVNVDEYYNKGYSEYCGYYEYRCIIVADIVVILYNEEISDKLAKITKLCRILGKTMLFLDSNNYGLPFS